VLGVPLHSPALLFERVTQAASGEVVEFTSSIYRGDRYRIVSELGDGGRPAVPIGLATRTVDAFL
jgi:GntR family transcriptional regulator